MEESIEASGHFVLEIRADQRRFLGSNSTQHGTGAFFNCRLYLELARLGLSHLI